MSYTVKPLCPADGEAFVQFMEGGAFSRAPDWSGCYCRYYHCAEEAWTGRTAPQNRAEALAAIEGGGMRGYFACDGARIIGWCNANELGAYALLAPELLPIMGAQRAGVVICFVIDPAYRRQGVARLLLDAAIAGFRAGGYDAVLALPVQTDTAEKSYRGTFHMYRERGFQAERHGEVSLMRLALGEGRFG